MTVSEQLWALPRPVTDTLLAFPSGVVGQYVPSVQEIPEPYIWAISEWNEVARNVIIMGDIPDGYVARKGIDYTQMDRHIRTVLGSYEISTTHKEAGIAYLLSLWLMRVE